MVVCVAGMHRSGTSMVARVLNLVGLDLGPAEALMPPTRDNPDGYWENAALSALNDEILQALDGSWKQPPTLRPGWSQGPTFDLLRYRAQGLVSTFDHNTCWGFKDPRTSLTLEFWRSLFPEMKVVVCLRNPAEVSTSLVKRQEDSLSFAAGLELWRVYYETLRLSLPKDRYLVTHYESYFYDAQAELRRLLDFCELPATDEAIAAATTAIRTDFRHHRLPHQALHYLKTTPIPRPVLQHYLSLCAEAGAVYQRMMQDDACQRAILEQHLQSLYDTLFRHETDLRWYQTTLHETQTTLAQQQAAHAALSASLAAENERLQAELRQQEATLTAAFIARLEALAAHQREQLHDLEALATQKIRALEAQMLTTHAAQSHQIEQLQAELAAMRNTRGWQMLERWWRFKKAVLPPASRRERLYFLARSALGILLTQGPFALLNRLFKWLRGERRYYGLASPLPPAARCAVDTDLSAPLVVGKGNVLHLTGWCFHPHQPVKNLRVHAGDRIVPILHFNQPRPDVAQAMLQEGYAGPFSLNSGFWVDIPFTEIAAPQSLTLTLHGQTDDGMPFSLPLGALHLQPFFP